MKMTPISIEVVLSLLTEAVRREVLLAWPTLVAAIWVPGTLGPTLLVFDGSAYYMVERT